jgi:hypothetical protein
MLLAGGVIVGSSAAMAGPAPAPAASDLIGSIDFYGLRKVTPGAARAALGVKEGDPVPRSAEQIAVLVRHLEAIPGVERARIERVCCDGRGRTLLFAGVQEQGSPNFRYLPAPTRAITLPPEVVTAYRRSEAAIEAAVQRGAAGDDLSQGHSLMTDPEARRTQEAFIPLATAHLQALREVLRSSRESEQRQIAAWVIGYAPKKGDVLPDLVRAVRDPDEGVRNNATRAVAAIAALAERKPELGLRIDPAPFITMLDSITWSDRNKAAMVLWALTSGRAPRVLDAVRGRAVPPLAEMARWKSEGHALPAFLILGRLAGLEEATIWEAWTRGERERVIERAVQPPSLKPPSSRRQR